MESKATEWARRMQNERNRKNANIARMGNERRANFAGLNLNRVASTRANLQIRTAKNNQAKLNAYSRKVAASEKRATNLASGNSPNFTNKLRNPLNRLSAKRNSWNPFKKYRKSKSRKNRSTRKRN